MALPLANKVALVTGSSRNIGAAIVKRLAFDGANVVVNYVANKSAADEVVQLINTEGRGKAVAVRADMSYVQEAARLVEGTVQTFGRLDILVLNAAIVRGMSPEDITERDFDEHFQTNVKVPLFTVQAASRHLKAGSRVLFFSSSTTKFSGASPQYLLYTATKGAIEQITRVLAKDLGVRGITVNAIAPGPVDTELFHQGKSEEMVQLLTNLHPAKRIAQPDDVSPIVAFLAREEAGWVNGQTISVNGGYAV